MQASRDILLINPEGSFNCFLNVVVQMMWRMDWFNPIIESLLKIEHPSGVIKSLCDIFSEIINNVQTSFDVPTLSVDKIRITLAKATSS